MDDKQKNIFDLNLGVPLIATEIHFTNFSIYYKVKIDSERNFSGVVFCGNDIKNKDLILNPTFVDRENNEVCFVVGNVTSHFYKDVLDRSIRGFEEYKNELNNIYKVGEVVGYINSNISK